ncbi:MAG: hypothetical protein AAB798_01250 [Patescibacteria group bacterium]
MTDDFLGKFLGNQNRARIVRVFILSQAEIFTAAHMAKRSGVSSAGVEEEIKSLEQLGIVKKAKFSINVGATKHVAGKQNIRAWSFDSASKYSAPLSKFVHEVSPVEHKGIIDALKRSGRLAAAILSGSFVGDPTRPVEIIVVADNSNESRLDSAIRALESSLGREIRYAAFSSPEFQYRLTIHDKLIRDTLDYPHIILLDKLRVL